MTLTLLTFDDVMARPDLAELPVEIIQRLGVEPDGTRLAHDGVVGPRTRRALYVDPAQMAHPMARWMVGELLAGVEELPGQNNRGARIDEYKRHSKRFARGPWCAEMPSFGLRELYGTDAPYKRGARRLALAVAAWMGEKIVDPLELEQGAVGSFKRLSKRTKFAGHAFVVAGVTEEHLWTIEGNRGGDGAVRVFRYDRADPRMSDGEPFLYAGLPPKDIHDGN